MTTSFIMKIIGQLSKPSIELSFAMCMQLHFTDLDHVQEIILFLVQGVLFKTMLHQYVVFGDGDLNSCFVLFKVSTYQVVSQTRDL